jgi:CheY-like chemotaxis protein
MESVLLVEDDPVTLVMATLVLESLGHHVVAETTVAGALGRLTMPDASFVRLDVDHDLPGRHGGPGGCRGAHPDADDVPVVLHPPAVTCTSSRSA